MNINQPSWVYILRCNDDSYYTGVTTDLKRRMHQHDTHFYGMKAYTASRLPVTLIYKEEYTNYTDACRRERLLKTLSREKKDALIATNPL